MTADSPDRVIFIDDYISMSDITVVDSSPVLTLLPKVDPEIMYVNVQVSKLTRDSPFAHKLSLAATMHSMAHTPISLCITSKIFLTSITIRTTRTIFRFLQTTTFANMFLQARYPHRCRSRLGCDLLCCHAHYYS